MPPTLLLKTNSSRTNDQENNNYSSPKTLLVSSPLARTSSMSPLEVRQCGKQSSLRYLNGTYRRKESENGRIATTEKRRTQQIPNVDAQSDLNIHLVTPKCYIKRLKGDKTRNALACKRAPQHVGLERSVPALGR